jgi:hypothetical protein
MCSSNDVHHVPIHRDFLPMSRSLHHQVILEFPTQTRTDRTENGYLLRYWYWYAVFHNVVYDKGLIWKSPAQTSSIHHTENWYLLRCSRTSFATRNFHHPVDLQELEVGQPTSRVRSIHIQIIGLENCVVLTLEELCSSNDVHHVLIH